MSIVDSQLEVKGRFQVHIHGSTEIRTTSFDFFQMLPLCGARPIDLAHYTGAAEQMNRKCLSLIAAFLCWTSTLTVQPVGAVETGLSGAAEAGIVDGKVIETTMPPQYKEVIKPELAAKYQFKYDGDFTKASGLPTYEWMPVGMPPKAIVIAIHGLTLHGRRYRVLGRVLATNGIGLISMDMRGFGRCKFDPKKQFSTPQDDKTHVSHHKSYEDLVKLLIAVSDQYPGQRVIVMGESLGCTYAVKLAAEHQEHVDGIILSAPAVVVNPDMFIGHGNIRQGVSALVKPSHMVELNAFMRNLVSNSPDVVNEMLDDPHILKALPIVPLLSTDEFVGHTQEWGAGVHPHLPVLIIQGSKDKCVSAKHVVDLTNAMKSDDQTIAWRGNYGHLQLETLFVRATILEALVDWLYNHSTDMQPRLDKAQESINALGGRIVK
jgi:acylglycerol lipase